MIDWKIFLTIALSAGLVVLCLAIAVIIRERFFKRSSVSPTTSTTPPTTNEKETEEEEKEKSKDRNWPWLALIGIVVVPLGIAMSIVFLTFNYTWTLPIVGTLRTPFLFLGLALVYLGFCLKTVKKEEYGVITLFGRMVKTVDEGLVFVPFWISQLFRFSTEQKTIEIGSGEQITPDTDGESPIIQCPKEIMVTFGDYEELATTPLPNGLPEWDGRKDAKDPFNRRVRASVKITIVVKIARQAVQQFVREVGTFEHGIAQLEKNARGVVDNICTKMTWAHFNHNQKEVAACLLASLEAFVADPKPQSFKHPAWRPIPKAVCWGLDIISVAVQPSAFAESVQTAFDSVASARQKKIATITDAAAARKKLEEDGEGNAAARKAMLFAEAEGAEKFGQICAESPEALALATLKAQENIAKEADFIIAPDADLVGLLAKGKKVLDRVGKGGTP